MTSQRASQIVSFYEGGADHRGRTLERILAEPDAWLEATHDYIQWVFPLPERSAYNPAAPLLTRSDIAAFEARPELRPRLLAAFGRLLDFYGFALASDQPRQCTITPSGHHAERTAQWVRPHDHNFLRISRILRCLHLLGCPQAASAFLAALEELARGDAGRTVGAVTLAYWRTAASGELRG